MYFSSLSVDLEVVKLEPGVAKSELVLFKVKDVKDDRLLVVLEVHGKSNRVGDITNLV